MFTSIARAASALWNGSRRLLPTVLGAWTWEAPPWSRWVGRRLQGAAHVLRATVRRRPGRAAAAGAAVFAALLGLVTAWHWYARLPKPELVSYSITPPGRTRLEDESAKPEPLLLQFDRSAAALLQVGKNVPVAIPLQPQLAGNWRWLDDRTLEFRTSSDWPVGQTFKGVLPSTLFGPNIRPESYRFEFRSAAFEAHIANVELYQDPVDPGVKQGVFDVSFSHPVDPGELQQRVELRLAGQSQGVLGIGRETVAFSVVYDKLRLHASIHSVALPIPHDPTLLHLDIGAGVRALRGGARASTALHASVAVPGLYSLSVQDVEPQVVETDLDAPDQVLVLNLSASTGERDVARALHAWVLPTLHPHAPAPARPDLEPYAWYDTREVTDDLLTQATAVPLEALPGEREYVADHSFRYHAGVGRYLLVQVDKNLRSFGGYLTPATQRYIVRVPPFPPQIKLLSQGALLALHGERKMAAMVRDLPGIEVEIGRVLPGQLQHLVSQSDGDFAVPAFTSNFGADNLVERFTTRTPLGAVAPGHPHYESIDLGQYLQADGGAKRGLFLVTVRGYDPAAHTRADARFGAFADARLVLVTDLGIVVKKSADGAQDVFVESLQTGKPKPDVTVQIIALNGTTLFSQATDADGRAHFDRVDGLTRERAPLLVEAHKDGDMSFLPLNRADRTLDYSRFDVGGEHNARGATDISACLFSDRALYRPGETLHVGMIVKPADWSAALTGIPLEYEVIDARGLTVQRERVQLPAGGFTEISHALPEAAATGTYTVNLHIVKDDRAGTLIGSTTLRVQEFAPDRMQVVTRLSAASSDGWVSPKALKALVNVKNLFGTPADKRRVAALLTLTPAFPAFRGFADYRFYDPLRAKDGYSEQLQDATTDAAGDAVFDLGLQKYAGATYRVHVLTQAFEPGAGRAVSSDASVLVSELPFLVGFKADGALDYVARGTRRRVSFIAIDPAARPTAVAGLRLRRIETQYVSVLTKQPNGTYRYESRKKESVLSEQPFSIPADGYELDLPSDAAGTYAYSVSDAAGLELNRVEYAVAGQGNVSRSLERNAELQVHLDKQDYAPGETIALSIQAPYAGAGLITIERDHVYAVQWFSSRTTASVQHIRLPADFEGNGYVNVQFIRDPASAEIFTSPLSYGVAPFMTSLARRTQQLTLTTPQVIKPGAELTMRLESPRATRAVVFAVDRGILQTAQYRTPDPLGEFFKKRALEVRTTQILDLILPEFSRLRSAAPGGDGEAALRRNLNPFKRKRDRPAVYWSGIVDVQRSREFTWTVPDTFNGTLDVFAVAVDESRIGIAQAETVVHGDFVLTPNMPVAVAPGDEFEVSVGVANTLPSGGTAMVQVQALLPAQLEAVGATATTLKIAAGGEAVALFRFRARPPLGAATVTFSAATGSYAAQLSSSVSVRPASPYVAEISAGSFAAAVDIPVGRVLHPEFRKLELSVSTLPLVLMPGLATYLDNYPHLCTEQLVSRGFAALIAARHPELGAPDAPQPTAADADAALLTVLRTRQNADGGFGLWTASVDADPFASVYAIEWLIEAQDQGRRIPDDLLQRALVWLQGYAASPASGDDLWEFRNRAYATYLLTRRGMVTTPIVAGLRESLDARFPHRWQQDVTAAYLAGIYALQRQDRAAAELIGHSFAVLGRREAVPEHASRYYDDAAGDAQILYLLARHFPERARALDPTVLESLVAPLNRGEYNTLSASLLLLAFDAYATAVPRAAIEKFSAGESTAVRKETPLPLRGHLILRSDYDGDATRLRLRNHSGVTGFYAASSAGFDTQPPTAALQQGMEIVRELLDADDRPVTRVRTGEELTVRLRVRALDDDFIPHVAVTDLLPGGFEPVVQPPAAASAGTGPATGWRPEFADVRDDRVVLYGSIGKDMAEYRYRIRATNAGSFVMPPSYAESMYDRRLRARSAPGRIAVVQPGAP